MNPEILFGALGLIISLVFFAGSLLLAARGIRRATLQNQRLRDNLARAEARFEQMDKQAEIANKAIDKRRARLAELHTDLAKLREETNGIILRAESPIYVLNDRWTVADAEFLAPVRNASMAGRPIQNLVITSWVDTRTYVVWAPTPEIATRQVETRFPSASGYEIGDIVPSPLKLAPRWASLEPIAAPAKK